MFTLMRDGLTAQAARLQLPGLAATVVIAESFYKFHSFTLEFIAALLTWTVIDAVLNVVAYGFGALRRTTAVRTRQPG